MQTIFVNFPVTDLFRARNFYAGLGLRFDERFSDDRAACCVVGDNIYLMLLTRDYFQTFAPRPVGDPSREVSVLVALSRDSREDVDAFMEAGLRAGGSDNGKVQDFGFMYGRSLSDPDGNILEPMWMDPSAVQATPDAQGAA